MLESTAYKTIKEHKMLCPGDRVLVAVSGGPDSVCLLHFLLSYPKIRVSAAHFNHMVRKGDAECDEEFVKDLCKKWRVPFMAGRADVPVYAKKTKKTVEEAARALRYGFLEHSAKKTGASKIAVGHNADDNVETFIIRLLRGTGLKGLRAIPPVNGKVIRPLIDVSRREILEYIKVNKLQFVRDASNDDIKYTRNRVRKELLPALTRARKNIRPQILGLIKAITSEYKKVEKAAEKALKDCAVSVSNDRAVLVLEKLLKLPLAVRTHMIRAAIEKVKGDLKDIYKVHIEGILALKKGELHLPGRLFVVRDMEKLTITRKKPVKIRTRPFKYILKIPGKVRIRESGKMMSVSFVKRPPPFKKIGKNEAYIDADKVRGRVLYVRNCKKGDRFVPLGMKGSKKLSDLFTDEKVLPEERLRTPVVCDNEKIVWVAGIRVDDRAKMDQKSKRTIKISCP